MKLYIAEKIHAVGSQAQSHLTQALIAALMFLTSVLSGCSTLPGQVPLTPPASAMIKAKPLPQLPVNDKADPNQPSGIGLAELADSDLEITKLYRELAIRHDELVDYVESILKKQAE